MQGEITLGKCATPELEHAFLAFRYLLHLLESDFDIQVRVEFISSAVSELVAAGGLIGFFAENSIAFIRIGAVFGSL
jgi:hypothetical protein